MKSKYYIVPLLFIAFLAVSAISETPKNNEEGGYKNLQVLPKDISKQKLDSIMQTFNNSLGVKCSFCHAQAADTSLHKLDFSSDAKDEKNITRSMMKMTENINGNFFNFRNSNRPDTINFVLCYTCHRGSPHPDPKFFIKQLEVMRKDKEKKKK